MHSINSMHDTMKFVGKPTKPIKNDRNKPQPTWKSDTKSWKDKKINSIKNKGGKVPGALICWFPIFLTILE